MFGGEQLNPLAESDARLLADETSLTTRQKRTRITRLIRAHHLVQKVPKPLPPSWMRVEPTGKNSQISPPDICPACKHS